MAAKDALVTEIQPWDGEKMVLPGTTVTAGQLLISGVVEDDYSGVRYLRGMGVVYGRTWYTLQCRVPLTASEKRYTGEEETYRALLVGKKRINLYFGSSISLDNCDKILSWDTWSLPGGIPLPVTTETAVVRHYELEERRRTEEEALALADQVLTSRLAGYIGDGEVLSRELTGQVEGDTLLVTLTAECREQIGQFVEIPKE